MKPLAISFQTFSRIHHDLEAHITGIAIRFSNGTYLYVDYFIMILLTTEVTYG
jgi:hypothetical protein